jgi:hypothetical protein
MGMESPDNRREADDSYRVLFAPVGDYLPGRRPETRGAMLKAIPWDVWFAAALAVVAILAAIFELGPAVFIVACLFLCGYIVVQVIGGKST